MQTIRTLLLLVFMAVTLLLAAARPARAQDIPETGGRVLGLVGGVFGDGDTTVLISGGAGLRSTKQLGLDFEVLYAPNLGLPTDEEHIGQLAGGCNRHHDFPSEAHEIVQRRFRQAFHVAVGTVVGLVVDRGRGSDPVALNTARAEESHVGGSVQHGRQRGGASVKPLGYRLQSAEHLIVES